MKYLFVDNFRGFKNTYFPLEGVNFLVGENSTGKSSLLGLLKLVSSNEFWFSNDSFDTEDINLGNFSDIVSVNSRDKSHFSLGLISGMEDSDAGSIKAFMIVYVEREGIASPAFFAYTIDDKDRIVRIGPSQTKFKTLSSSFESSKNIFNRWLDVYNHDTKGYKLLPANLTDAPLGFLMSFVESELGELRTKGLSPLINSSLREDITWLAPIRTKPRRTYDEFKLDFSPEGDHTPYLIKKMLSSKSESKRFESYLAKIGRESGLFESVRIRSYGKSATAPFELDVKLNGKDLSVHNVGYGVSQALPIIVELFAQVKHSSYALQQPEVHLHPRAQAALGDVIYALARGESKRFLVETHSDYLIDRFRYRYRKSKANPPAQILFFERTGDGNKVTPINIQPNGDLSDDQPQSYRDFFIKEEMRGLGIEE